jgi:hypothetical protein
MPIWETAVQRPIQVGRLQYIFSLVFVVFFDDFAPCLYVDDFAVWICFAYITCLFSFCDYFRPMTMPVREKAM